MSLLGHNRWPLLVIFTLVLMPEKGASSDALSARLQLCLDALTRTFEWAAPVENWINGRTETYFLAGTFQEATPFHRDLILSSLIRFYHSDRPFFARRYNGYTRRHTSERLWLSQRERHGRILDALNDLLGWDATPRVLEKALPFLVEVAKSSPDVENRLLAAQIIVKHSGGLSRERQAQMILAIATDFRDRILRTPVDVSTEGRFPHPNGFAVSVMEFYTTSLLPAVAQATAHDTALSLLAQVGAKIDDEKRQWTASGQLSYGLQTADLQMRDTTFALLAGKMVEASRRGQLREVNAALSEYQRMIRSREPSWHTLHLMSLHLARMTGLEVSVRFAQLKRDYETILTNDLSEADQRALNRYRAYIAENPTRLHNQGRVVGFHTVAFASYEDNEIWSKIDSGLVSGDNGELILNVIRADTLTEYRGYGLHNLLLAHLLAKNPAVQQVKFTIDESNRDAYASAGGSLQSNRNDRFNFAASECAIFLTPTGRSLRTLGFTRIVGVMPDEQHPTFLFARED